MKVRNRNNLVAFALGAWFLLVGASLASPDDVRAFYDRFTRVQSITRQILASNTDACANKQNDFGYAAVTADPTASAPVQAAWVNGLRLGRGPTVVAVYPGGPAQAAGLMIGDEIVAVNHVQWSSASENRSAFAQAMTNSHQTGSLQLTVRRGGAEEAMSVSAQQICAASAILSRSSRINAWANGSTIFIEGGLERRLSSDDELAWVIAHEAAHVFLGHTEAGLDEARRSAATRSTMEREADRLSVRFMLKARYAPEAAASAQPRLARAGRGPISRLLDLNGPYMGTAERTSFLTAKASAARGAYPHCPRAAELTAAASQRQARVFEAEIRFKSL